MFFSVPKLAHHGSGIRAAWLVGVAAVAALLASPAPAAPITYTMTWKDGVSGTYGGVAFTDGTMILTFTADTDNVVRDDPFEGRSSIYFPKGAGIKITLEAAGLTNQPLDDDDRNGAKLQATSEYGVLLQPTSIDTDWAGLGWDVALVASTYDVLTTESPTAAQYAYVSQPFSEIPLVIGGKDLLLPEVSQLPNGGQWGIAFTVSAAPTTTSIDSVSPKPVVTGRTYAVSGKVSVNVREDAPASGNLPGTVTVTGDGAGCTDSTLQVSAAGLGIYDYSCVVTAGPVGSAKTLTASYVDSTAPKAFADSSDTATQDVIAAPTVSCEGFFAPVDRRPTTNQANAGRVIPLKWRCNSSGTPVTTPPQDFRLTSGAFSCAAGSSTLDAVEEYATGGSGLINQGNGYWQFNWATPKSYANSCRSATVTFGGTTISADFKFVR